MGTEKQSQTASTPSYSPLSAPAHTLPYASVLQELSVNSEEGLSTQEAKSRLQKWGPNELEGDEGISLAKIIIRQVANAMMLVLIIAMAVSFGIESWIEGGVIGAVIALNIIVGVYQDYAAEKTMDSLRGLSSPTGVVTRDGKTGTIPAMEIVVGDMVDLKVGDTVPADLRLVETMNFETDEALLTGESLPVTKSSTTTFPADTGPGDRLNIAYSSSTVTRGRARGVVISTGMKTEIGAIAAALRENGNQRRRPVRRGPQGETKKRWYVVAWTLTCTDAVGRFLGINVGTPLQRKLSKLALLLFGIAVVFAIIVMGANDMRDDKEVIIYAVATGLAMIPACLVVVLTVTMAMGTKQMVERNVIVIDAMPGEGESEGDTKTPQDIVTNSALLQRYLDVAAMANLAHVHRSEENGQWQARGEPTDIAIQVFAARFDWGRERWTAGDKPVWTQQAEYPFDSTIKKMSVIFRRDDTDVIFTKGAVERVLEACTSIVWTTDTSEPVPLTDDIRNTILQNMEALAREGLRVLALAHRTSSSTFTDVPPRDTVEQDLTFAGLIGLYDPPRPETAGAIEECHRAGISVHMVTGDHPGTARAIAAQVGIIPANAQLLSRDVADNLVMTASQFDSLSESEIDALPTLPAVIARCAPHTKVRMIEALHRRGRYAAMTGDGVNDSPSLKRADVGIAMGQAGSDVAKDASELVLTDDNFASIINGIEEGRRIFDNIQKFVLHLLAENVGLALTLLIGLVFKDENGQSVFPIAPVEILWIIMITSGLPDIGLGMEMAASDVMDRPPQSKNGIFTPEIIIDTLVYGIWMAALCLSAFTLVLFAWGDGNLATECNSSYSTSCDTVFRARATTFVCMTWFALLLAWEMMHLRRSLFNMHDSSTPTSTSNSKPRTKYTGWLSDIYRNKYLFWGIVIGFVLTFPVLYIPVINDVVFKHIGIGWEWGVVFVEAGLFLGGVEGWKWVKRVFVRRWAAKRGDERNTIQGVGGSGRNGVDEEKGAGGFSRFTTLSREEGVLGLKKI
ncbi:sodium P-type ATPase [Aspergillus luchuensis]|uniref:P-type Na(+) transporter n=1 Tax=Aspergillus kawachii TaxID=1069201 RepID=A0A146FX82_ASPKA|nr:sodium P-type ATPase [Aspergillus luchuensis]